MSSTTLWTIVMVSVLLAAPLIGGLLDLGAEIFGGNDSTLSRFCQVTAWDHPPFRWMVALVLTIFIGHIFTTTPEYPLVPRIITLILFVVLPFALIAVTAIGRVRVMQYVPGGQTLTDNPHLSTTGFMALGYFIGAYLLHQVGTKP